MIKTVSLEVSYNTDNNIFYVETVCDEYSALVGITEDAMKLSTLILNGSRDLFDMASGLQDQGDPR